MRPPLPPLTSLTCPSKCHPAQSHHRSHHFILSTKETGSGARPPSGLHFRGTFETVAKLMFVPWCRSPAPRSHYAPPHPCSTQPSACLPLLLLRPLHPGSPAASPLSSPQTHPATQPGADRCARPPSRLQWRESDNIRSILFPVTHSPGPTAKWKRLLEVVNGVAEGELGHSGHCHVCVCACLPCTPIEHA